MFVTNLLVLGFSQVTEHGRKAQVMKYLLEPAKWLMILCCLAGSGVVVRAQEPLTLRQAIRQALDSNPEAKLASVGTKEAAAGAALARTQYLPQVSFTEDISGGNDPVYVFGAKLRQNQFTQADFNLDSLNKPEPLNNFATRLSGQWLAFDSFKTQKTVKSADLMKKSAASSAEAANQKVVLDVVQAYQSVLFAERQIEIAQHELETAEALLSSVDDHVKAGLAVESDRMSAQVSVAARKQALIAAQGERELSWSQLSMAMGEPELPATKLKPIEPHDFPQADLQQELSAAAKTRSDLNAVGQAREAQAAAVTAARLSFGPRINAYGNWEGDRQTFAGSGGHNWVAGVQIGIDLTPFAKREQLKRESAVKEQVDAQLTAYQHQVRLQVTQAHIQKQTAHLSLQTAHAAIDQATESLRILRNRYGAGLATITDLLRAEDAERESQNNYWRAVYGNAVAYAQLLFATGSLTPDKAEELQ